MKKITKKFWKEFVAKNSFDSYSLVVCLTVLSLWEAGCKTQEECDEEISKSDYGLSGAQAGMAINLVLNSEEPKWLDKEMVAVSRGNDIEITIK